MKSYRIFILLLTLLIAATLLAACDDTEKQEHTEHNYGEWVGNTATCTLGGTEQRACDGCDKIEQRETDPLLHDMVGNSCRRCGKSGFIPLIENKKASFNIIYTQDVGNKTKIAVAKLVNSLRERGVEISDPISDANADAVTAREIIIGINAKNRDDGAVIEDTYIGARGEEIRFDDSRIIIAGGNDEITKALFERFTDEMLDIPEGDGDITYLEVSTDNAHLLLTEYETKSITLAGLPLDQYAFITELGDNEYSFSAINSFVDKAFETAGYKLQFSSTANPDEVGPAIVVRLTDDKSNGDLHVRFVGDDLVFECAFPNALDEAFSNACNELFFTGEEHVTIAADYEYRLEVGTVHYEDFGAAGDGVTCDFAAILAAHKYANSGGQKVIADEGAHYYISAKNFTQTINVMTDVDFNGASFTVDDRGSAAYKYKKLSLFTVISSNETIELNSAKIAELAGEGYTVTRETTDLAWIAPMLKGKSIVMIFNSKHKDFIRHGNNESDGKPRREIFLVNADGSFAEDHVSAFDFEQLTSATVYSAYDAPITIENGCFNNICCRTVAETQYKNAYESYFRGFRIERSNVTVKNLTHRMINEPYVGEYESESGYVYDDHYVKYGSRHESYPYYGFINAAYVYNLNVVDASLTGHTMYYQDKKATASTGGVTPDPVRMGSYDIVIDFSYGAVFKNVSQYCETGIGDMRYYGIMASNGCKNLLFEGCSLNRFDAHMGVWNATLRDTVIGHTLNVIGGGELMLDGVTRLNSKSFISLRRDYGASFNGNITIKDCTFYSYGEYNTSLSQSQNTTPTSYGILIDSGFSTDNAGYTESNPKGAYWLWNFGYTCYMPREVTVDNLKYSPDKVYLFNDLPNDIFVQNYYGIGTPSKYSILYPYILTEKVIYKNMPSAIPLTKSPSCTTVRSITVRRENIG